MRIIYSEGFHIDERKEIRQVVFSNLIVAFKIIAEEMRELGMEYENSASAVSSFFLSPQRPEADQYRNTSGSSPQRKILGRKIISPSTACRQ